jgi:hypothetical protein
MTAQDWKERGAALRAPFDPQDVDFRPGRASGEKTQALCYVNARAVMDRLDDAVGPENWTFTYEPLAVENGVLKLAKGILTIHGVSKEDIGDASNAEPSKGTVSDALKRAAVVWGIGRYLYDVPTEWVKLDQFKHISAADMQRLRAHLPQPGARPRDPDEDENPDSTVAPPEHHADPHTSAPRTKAQREAISKRNRELGSRLGFKDALYAEEFFRVLGGPVAPTEVTDEQVDIWTAHLTDRIAEMEAAKVAGIAEMRKKLAPGTPELMDFVKERDAPLSFPTQGEPIENDLHGLAAGGRPN